MSKKPKEASDYLSDWCNQKISFEDALKDFAKMHVANALEEVANSAPLSNTDILTAYSVTNIK